MINIIFNSESVVEERSGKITGEIYFVIDGQCFPEKGWNDFPTIILSWWIQEFLRFKRNKEKNFEFLFMDGSFSLKGKIVEEKCKIFFIGLDIDEKCIAVVSQEDICDMLIKASEEFIQILKNNMISLEKHSNIVQSCNMLKKWKSSSFNMN